MAFRIGKRVVSEHLGVALAGVGIVLLYVWFGTRRMIIERGTWETEGGGGGHIYSGCDLSPTNSRRSGYGPSLVGKKNMERYVKWRDKSFQTSHAPERWVPEAIVDLIEGGTAYSQPLPYHRRIMKKSNEASLSIPHRPKLKRQHMKW